MLLQWHSISKAIRTGLQLLLLSHELHAQTTWPSAVAPTSANNLSIAYRCPTTSTIAGAYPSPGAFEFISSAVFPFIKPLNDEAPWINFQALPVLRNAEQLEAELLTECVLWDDCCLGNRSLAESRYFGIQGTLAFLEGGWKDRGNVVTDECPWGSLYCTPRLLALHAQIRKWSYDGDCSSLIPKYDRFRTTCCGQSRVIAGNVDLYYWPDPAADTSCLDIIGDEVFPIDYGATTNQGFTYWGCTWGTETPPNTIVTAEMVTESAINVTYKRYEDMYTCTETTSASWNSSRGPTTASVSGVPNWSLSALQLRQYGNRSAVSTVVSGEFTFTSPYIYAHFTNIIASDKCSYTKIPSTMFTFTDGELSTLAADPSQTKSLLTRAFNFRDLPCPPSDVPIARYWRPSRGEPYRPMIAAPDQLRNLNDWFKTLNYAWFTGFDPPHTLAPAAQMAQTMPVEVAAKSTPLPGALLNFAALPAATPAPSQDDPVKDGDHIKYQALAQTQANPASSDTSAASYQAVEDSSVNHQNAMDRVTNLQPNSQAASDTEGNAPAVANPVTPFVPANAHPDPQVQSALPQVQPTRSQDGASPQPQMSPSTNTVPAAQAGLPDSVFQSAAAVPVQNDGHLSVSNSGSGTSGQSIGGGSSSQQSQPIADSAPKDVIPINAGSGTAQQSSQPIASTNDLPPVNVGDAPKLNTANVGSISGSNGPTSGSSNTEPNHNPGTKQGDVSNLAASVQHSGDTTQQPTQQGGGAAQQNTQSNGGQSDGIHQQPSNRVSGITQPMTPPNGGQSGDNSQQASNEGSGITQQKSPSNGGQAVNSAAQGASGSFGNMGGGSRVSADQPLSQIEGDKVGIEQTSQGIGGPTHDQGQGSGGPGTTAHQNGDNAAASGHEQSSVPPSGEQGSTGSATYNSGVQGAVTDGSQKGSKGRTGDERGGTPGGDQAAGSGTQHIQGSASAKQDGSSPSNSNSQPYAGFRNTFFGMTNDQPSSNGPKGSSFGGGSSGAFGNRIGSGIGVSPLASGSIDGNEGGNSGSEVGVMPDASVAGTRLKPFFPNSRNDFGQSNPSQAVGDLSANTLSTVGENGKASPASLRGGGSNAPPIHVNNHTINPLTGGISIEGRVLTAGAPPVTLKGGDVVSLGSSALVVGNSTILRGSAVATNNTSTTSARLRSSVTMTTTQQPAGGFGGGNARSTTTRASFQSGGGCQSAEWHWSSMATIAGLTLLRTFDVF